MGGSLTLAFLAFGRNAPASVFSVAPADLSHNMKRRLEYILLYSTNAEEAISGRPPARSIRLYPVHQIVLFIFQVLVQQSSASSHQSLLFL
jgi:hypothetical protein